jgi:hypothetical protein
MLVLSNVLVHQSQLMVLLVLETVWIGPYLGNLLLLGEQVEQDEELALDKAEPLEDSGIVPQAVGHDVDPDEVGVPLAEESKPFEETCPTLDRFI